MINWNTIPMTYNDSWTYLEMMGKVLTVVQQMYDTLSHIEIDSEQININKEDIADLKESVSDLSDSVSDLTERMQAVETLTAGRITPEYCVFGEGDITISEPNCYISIPQSMRSADAYLISFSLSCEFSAVQHVQHIDMFVHRDTTSYYTTYVHTAGGDEPIRLLFDLSSDSSTVDIIIFSNADADSFSVFDTDAGGIAAFWKKTE